MIFVGEFQLPPSSFRPKYAIDPDRAPMDLTTNYGDSFRLFKFVSETPARTQSEQLPRILSRQASPQRKMSGGQQN